MDGNNSKAQLVAEFVRSWWGVVMPVLVYFISDMGLPKDDGTWWIPWMASLVSLASYLAGRFNGMSRTELSEIDRLRMELDAARHAAHKHEVEATKWKTAYTTRENTRFEIENQK